MSDEMLKPFHPVFTGNGEERIKPEDGLGLPPAPTWRRADRRKMERGATFQATSEEIEMVNAALYLRRPLLVTGKPGTGKTSLAYAIARELGLGEVLYWGITTRTTLKDGLYLYDAIARLQDANSVRTPVGETGEVRDRFENIGDYIRLGALGTALLPSKKPRVLIVDEIDKSDIDLPNDLLSVFEEGAFEIPELLRIEAVKPEVEVRSAYRDRQETTFNQGAVTEGKTTIIGGRVACDEFPLLILTSNGERDFPPPFLRRCVRLTMEEPGRDRLIQIVNAHLEQQLMQDRSENSEVEDPPSPLGKGGSDGKGGSECCGVSGEVIEELIDGFIKKRNDRSRGALATDQLLNAIYIVLRERDANLTSRKDLINRLWKHLSSSEDQQSDRSLKR